KRKCRLTPQPGPLRRGLQGRLILSAHFFGTARRRIDDDDHFYRAIRPVAEPERLQTADQVRLVKTRNYDHNAQVRRRRRGDLALAKAESPEIIVSFRARHGYPFQVIGSTSRSPLDRSKFGWRMNSD